VTILHNVINPLRGEKTNLHYVVDKPGYVTITVFDLSGDIVNVLYRGQQAAGQYSTSWDGRNRGGRIVARGLYFVRVVGPGFDEMRKVLVVK
jgi:flagellar hook assembly protein FlgD